jgi:hypothetical protein
MDNYLLAELGTRDADGNLTCQTLTDVTKESFLITTVEEEQLMEGEEYVDFYNATSEPVRLTRLETGVRFDTSAFSLNAGVTEVVRGLVAHFDPTTKKYILSTVGSPHASYATANKKFEVVDEDSDFGYALGKSTIKLECK